MLVIGGRELRFRVNVRPTNSDIAPENYGPFTICQPYRRPRCGASRKPFSNLAGRNSKAIEDRAGGMANRIFPRLP
jgi:hypothetical protein